MDASDGARETLLRGDCRGGDGCLVSVGRVFLKSWTHQRTWPGRSVGRAASRRSSSWGCCSDESCSVAASVISSRLGTESSVCDWSVSQVPCLGRGREPAVAAVAEAAAAAAGCGGGGGACTGCGGRGCCWRRCCSTRRSSSPAVAVRRPATAWGFSKAGYTEEDPVWGAVLLGRAPMVE